MNKPFFHKPIILVVVGVLLGMSLTACSVASAEQADSPPPNTVSTTVTRAESQRLELTPDVVDPPSLPNLNLDSDSEMILQKIRWSHTTWQTLWAEGLDRWMSPDGSGVIQGEVRSQAWVSQPGQSLKEMYGHQGEEPTFMQVLDGVSWLRMDSSGQYREIVAAPDFLDGLYAPDQEAPEEEARHPLGRILQTALARLVFPFPVDTGEVALKGIAMEEAAGRVTLVVDLLRAGDVRTDRLWVDAETGILLVRQHFGRGGSAQPLSETRLTAIAYDPPIPEGCFSLAFEDIPGFEEPPSVGNTENPENNSVSVVPGMGSVNLRQGPGTDFDVIGQFTEGAKASVIATTASRDWLQLFLDGGPAWVYAPLVQFVGDPSSVPIKDDRSPVPILNSDIDLDRATEVIKSFTGKSGIRLSLVDVSAMPNAGLRPGWQLVDESGRPYWLDVETYHLVQIEPAPVINADPSGSKSVEDLRQIAERIALEHSLQFGGLMDVLVYSEGDKLGQTFFFQWEDRTKPWGSMLQMLQVGLTSDGQLLSWLNTLDLTD